jgi:chemotaxis protein CheY-P-specific phosphatase CheC
MHVDALKKELIGTTMKIDDYGIDILKEYSAVVAGAYVTSLSKMTDLKISFAVPQFSRESCRNIYELQICRNMHQDCPKVFSIHNVLYRDDCDLPIYSDLLFLCPPESIEKIMKGALAKAGKRR